jgi:ribonuclease G
MAKEMFISSSPHETKVAVLEDDQLVEVYYERDTDVGLAGGIYKGRVSRVLPGMQSAFVDVGLERDAFLYVTDFFSEDQEEYDKVFEEAEARATRFTAEQAQAAEPQPTQPVEPVSKEVTPETTSSVPAASAELAVAPPPQAAPEGRPSEPPPLESHVAGPPAPGTPAPLAETSGESHEYRRLDPRGRRHRRRGRPFAENRHGEHRFPPKPESSGPRAFEILPGESLAKYSHTTGEISPPQKAAAEPSALPDAGSASWAPSGGVIAPGMAAPEAPAVEAVPVEASPSVAETPEPEARSDTVSEPPQAYVSSPGSEFSSAPEGTAVEVPSVGPPPILGGAEPPIIEAGELPTEAGSAEAPELAVAFEAGPAAFPVEPPVTESPLPSTEAEAPTQHAAGEVPPAVEAIPSPAESAGAGGLEQALPPEPPRGPAPLSPTPEQVAAEAPAPVQTDQGETSGVPADRTYTLREPHQRPRFAPRRGRRGRSGTDSRAPRQEGRRESPRPGNHPPVQIAELLKEGQEILVQIAKEPLGTKGARITSHIALPGRYLVYMPTIDHIGVSRKIASEEERLRLRNIILENRGPLTGGFIVRTAGQGRAEEEFQADLKFLSTLWNEIRAKADRVKAPALIHRDLDLVQRLLRDTLTPDFKCVRVDNEIEYERVLDFVNRSQPSLVGKVKLYTRDTPLFEEVGIQAEIEKALKPKVWLKSGGYIVINQTEALVAIDVNTGKYVGKTNRLEDTILKTNVDAVNEIVRQVRLRDLGGIIVIDFIDMDERKNRQKVAQALEEALHHDRAPTKVISFHDFGLVAITRKRVKQSLERTLCEPCEYCGGSGWIRSVTSVCHGILAEARKMAKQIEGNTLTLRVSPEVAKALKSREGALISELESLTRKDVIIKGDPMVHQERFEIY